MPNNNRFVAMTHQPGDSQNELSVLQPLDTALLWFARRGVGSLDSHFIYTKNKVFRCVYAAVFAC